ncbi:hypothetical protein [Azospirillum brasilense]|uniref:hypothetical protein n=1 Tax=Azospirillum brasilense TaxID=192 RepID=UPI0011A51615|nr:hypothetical protein [Azospirillum brasilense]
MDINAKITENGDDSLVAYSSRFEHFAALISNISVTVLGFFLFKTSELNELSGWLSIIIIVFGCIKSAENLSLMIHSGPIIIADKNGLFVYGQTVSSIKWVDFKSAEHSMMWGTNGIPYTYNLRISNDRKNLVRRSINSFYTSRVITLSSFGSTASAKDIRRALKAYVPNLLWHIESDRMDKNSG